jgi:hypothetical protein
MTDKERLERIARQRFHGLYLSRRCGDLVELSRGILGMHCWFHRNVAFSAVIRGADIAGWKTRLTKTWLYRGTLHGVAYDELPGLLALHGEAWIERFFSAALISEIADEVLRLMEDGVFSRAEMRKIFIQRYDPKLVEHMFSPWGGIFVYLAARGLVAFRDMTSRDFDMIDAEPAETRDDVLPGLFRRYMSAYGPATLDDAAWFFGFQREDKKLMKALPLDEYESFELAGKTYYHCDEPSGMSDVPELTLLSGFDPVIVSYVERGAVLPPEYKTKVILKSGICLPTVAVNGRIAGIWNIKGNKPVLELFEKQSARLERKALELVEDMRFRTAGRM